MKVAVLMIIYNQEKYIAQALDSILMQQVDFDYEIVIGEDASTDRTREIVLEYAGKHPDKIRVMLRARAEAERERALRLGGKTNFIKTFQACQGEYIAWLDGDDYWTDPCKLQKQVTFMESHPECALCCHPVSVVYSDDRAQIWPPVIGVGPREIVTMKDLISSAGRIELPSSGMMMRGGIINQLPDWFYEAFNGDRAMHFLLAHHGNIGFLKECMAVHRKHGGGVSRMYEVDLDYCNEMELKLLLQIDRHFGYQYHALIKEQLADLWRRKARAHKTKREHLKASRAFARYLLIDLTTPVSIVRRANQVVRFVLQYLIRAEATLIRWVPKPVRKIIKNVFGNRALLSNNFTDALAQKPRTEMSEPPLVSNTKRP